MLNRVSQLTSGRNIGGRSGGISQQAIGVQVHQPLVFLHIALEARQIFAPPRVDQAHLETFPLQNFLQRRPIGRVRRERSACAGADSSSFFSPARLFRNASMMSTAAFEGAGA